MNPVRAGWIVRGLAVVAALVVALSAAPLGAVAQAPASAAPASAAPAPSAVMQAPVVGFQPGNIIADSVFFAKDAMSAAGIQSFLEAQVPLCQAGYTCLKDFRMPTTSRAADAMCTAPYVGRSSETAAQIVFNVAQACGINPQVLLVTLQKEQGLVTHTWPSDWRYTIAMGQGCPDTAACDTRYYGFFNQVYGAAWQLKRYANPPGTSAYFTWYRPGATWNVRYHPNTACGSSPVYIANQATANLYYYTPYQPNAASIAAGLGEGDACSSYGNRNFFTYFTRWFGSTSATTTPAIAERYAQLGGAGGPLGAALGGVRCGLPAGGCYQMFEGGRLYWSPASGAYSVRGGILSTYQTAGYERGPLGYPVSEESCGLPQDGCYQLFQYGQIHWTPATGGQATYGEILATWAAGGYERGALGYPVGPVRCGLPADGCYQMFQGGRIYQASGAGTNAVLSDVLVEWGASGFERGVLGYPVGSRRCGLPADGCYQMFQGGRIYWSPTTPMLSVRPPALEAWGASGFERGALGYPVGPRRCGLPADGCYQMFQGGRIYWSPTTPAVSVRPPVLDAWGTSGFERGALGYPIGGLRCGLASDGCYQMFQGGRVYWTPSTGGYAVRGLVLDAWAAAGYERSSYGYPISDAVCDAAGCVQVFQGGEIRVPPSG